MFQFLHESQYFTGNVCTPHSRSQIVQREVAARTSGQPRAPPSQTHPRNATSPLAPLPQAGAKHRTAAARSAAAALMSRPNAKTPPVKSTSPRPAEPASHTAGSSPGTNLSPQAASQLPKPRSRVKTGPPRIVFGTRVEPPRVGVEDPDLQQADAVDNNGNAAPKQKPSAAAVAGDRPTKSPQNNRNGSSGGGGGGTRPVGSPGGGKGPDLRAISPALRSIQPPAHGPPLWPRTPGSVRDSIESRTAVSDVSGVQPTDIPVWFSTLIMLARSYDLSLSAG